ncbi:efflux RND transporter periplasmic adaptor subunit [Thalassotalea mangrovi]|uniref:Efflux RND transporter periplasmic adaptor subunit n=1 Tax=Thalassotalea mangrovi TaxID=2572245 RepID=A0A4U1B4N3_9GAMM|nr:efflux RND transporter periplasmic adaptor subunit [Thalassotalea mangrovi]TKB45340.1 efflux RND transporter periplasmic adaptor subunit [Thalassotalea mangrovi]
MQTSSPNSSAASKNPYTIAIVISILLILWLASGFIFKSSAPTEQEEQQLPLPQVKVETFQSKPITNTIQLYGRTEPDRIVTLRAQVKGAIIHVFAERGSFVNKGDVIAKIALNDLPAKLEHYQTLLKQRRIEYYGAKKLFTGGFQGESALAQKLADVTDAKAMLAQIETDIANTTVVAPFSGVLNERMVEVGDYLSPGDEIAIIADLDPLVIRAHLTENQVLQVRERQSANIHLLSHRNLTGTLRYLASVANEQTNTFKAEITIANPDYRYRAGISSEVELPLQQVNAIKVSPAILTLDEQGNIGVKTVSEDIVHFTPIQMVKSEEDGVWLTGLDDTVQVITLGQGFVRPGDKVQAVNSNIMEP